MKQFTQYVGLDVHKDTIAVAVADASDGEVRYVGEIASTPEAITKLARRLKKGAARLAWCYEAGPCGYHLYRQLSRAGEDCQVVAPSLIPRKSGDRVKTDRRDALSLARLHRAGELTAVWVPDQAQEALRDLTRAREDMKGLQRQARQRLSAFLLRQGPRFPGKCKWTKTYFRWLDTVKFESPVQQIVFQEYIEVVHACGRRVQAIDEQLAMVARESVFWPVIEALMALRGINLLSATAIVAEIGDLHRFASARQLMAYLGLVPSEHSSGSKTVRGSITKTGNGHVRRLLIEAAWTYRHPARKTPWMRTHKGEASEVIQDIAWKAQKRLCQRYRHLMARGKQSVQASTAVARELAGFIWAVGQAVPGPAAH